jgi:hypothetical protein
MIGESGRQSRVDQDVSIRAAIGTWRDGLINLTRRNPLVNFRASRTGTIAIMRPSPMDVLARLRANKEFILRSIAPTETEEGEPAPVPPPEPGVLDTEKNVTDMTAALHSLMRRSTQEFLDKGLSVLYLAFGTLRWTDVDKISQTSPLLLVPVQLQSVGPRQLPRLVPGDDDPVMNPALALKLSEFSIELPRVGDLDEVDLASLFRSVESAVRDQPGWRVDEGLVLSAFSFAKEAMYRDLLDNEDVIAAHAGVRALAGTGGQEGQEASFYFDEIPEEQVDRQAPPEQTPVILDADSSQRACVAAALAGRSFVMDGPPGTGKSQTIANMIATLLHSGKTVLFVSEKAAALDVVRDRLTGAGLGAYLLELHSHKATRKEVATAIGQALDSKPVPPPPMPNINLDTLRKRREQLNAYADAMNTPRLPLGSALHDVLGIIANLNDVPAAPATGTAPTDLTVEAFNNILTAARTLSGAWRPAAQGRSFVWRGLTATGSMDALLYQALSAIETLTGMVRVNAELRDATGLTRPSQSLALAAILSHQATRPAGLPDAWLTTPDLSSIEQQVTWLAATLASIETRTAEATQAAGAEWSLIPRLDSVTSGAIGTDNLTTSQMTGLARRIANDAAMLELRTQTLSGVAAMLGIASPRTFAEADNLLSIATLSQAAERPERAWLSADGLTVAEAAARTLRSAIDRLAQAEEHATPYFTQSVMREDVGELARRYENHHGFGKLSGEYRADKRILASITREGVTADAARRHLPLAVAWKEAATAFDDAAAMSGEFLGTYYSGRSTDFTRLFAALGHAAGAVRAAQGQDLSTAARYIARDARPDLQLLGMVEDTGRDLSAWRDSPGATVRPELLAGAIADAIAWLREQDRPLGEAANYAGQVGSAVNREITFGQARYLVSLRIAADEAHARLTERAAHLTDSLGDLFEGTVTELPALRSSIAWVRRLRELVTGGDLPLTPGQAKAVAHAIPSPQLASASEQWSVAAGALLANFDETRRDSLAAELDDYEEARDILESLREDTSGPDEWRTFQACRTTLASYGLSVAIEFCIGERVPPEQVPDVIKRALLQEWADHQLRTDPALATVRGIDRDDLVASYRRLDRELIAAATGEIIRACNARRPRSDFGQAATIRHEAEKKRRHMPVRRLIEQTRNVTQQIKPCFMMSPLAVSQFLPPGVRFDVVIFDEASQVSPGDAINCVYRGNALILSGDQKQLPPTDFFATSKTDLGDEWSEDIDDTTDFQSVLDLAKASGSYRSLTLRWHYRSKHEALIAFSNVRFYQGKLVTFPGQHSEGPDVGVEMFRVNGTYRRGTSRDNPGEAEAVAKRVIHHFDTRPQMTLGVVAFSEAQASAIDAAVLEARESRPDLERFFTNDRLNGFFVKNLESVQGDERDVMIFSIGYGPDENGKVLMTFGPLTKKEGWKRLNVAVTRARYRNEIVASIDAGDIPGSIPNESIRQLRNYLDYAARGMVALALDDGTGSGGDPESPFEESVIAVIRSWGYDVTPQVGTAGYRIDMGVRHPSYPGAYALGVECDGYQYHSSRVARDRDRLREQVLRDKGWKLHRIWGTAWYRDRRGEEDRLRSAIERAVAAPVHGLLGAGSDEVTRPVVDTEAAVFDPVPGWAVSYATASVRPLPHWVDPGDPGSRFEMRDAIRDIAMVEAPLHVSLLHQRLRTAWNIGRVGASIRENIDAAIRLTGVRRAGDFILPESDDLVRVRTPTKECARTIEQVHNAELARALVYVVHDNAGISRDALTTRVAQIYGWGRRGSDISRKLETVIAAAIGAGVLSEENGSLVVTAQG